MKRERERYIYNIYIYIHIILYIHVCSYEYTHLDTWFMMGCMYPLTPCLLVSIDRLWGLASPSRRSTDSIARTERRTRHDAASQLGYWFLNRNVFFCRKVKHHQTFCGVGKVKMKKTRLRCISMFSDIIDGLGCCAQLMYDRTNLTWSNIRGGSCSWKIQFVTEIACGPRGFTQYTRGFSLITSTYVMKARGSHGKPMISLLEYTVEIEMPPKRWNCVDVIQ